jgi:hypothetical protein
MPIIAKTNGDGGGRSFEPAPVGVHQAVCVDVVDLGWLETTWQGVTQKKHKVNVAWQLAEDRADGKPYLVFKRYSLSLHEKANLRKDIESWRGRKLSHDEEMGFDLETLIGKNCLLNIHHRESGDKVYANVASVNPLMKGMQALAVRDYVRKVQRTANEVDDNEPPPLTDDDIAF